MTNPEPRPEMRFRDGGDMVPVPELHFRWNDRLAAAIANFALVWIAGPLYRDMIHGSILLGMRTAAEQREDRP